MVTGSAADAAVSPEDRPETNSPRESVAAAAEPHVVESFTAFLQSLLGQPGNWMSRDYVAELIL